MNSSQPVGSSIGAVDFAFLSPDEIKKLSVKRITNRVTFDSLLHPTAGGLYDPALGAFADNLCSTCHLNTHSCPGHCGHIELPVYVYHCVFMDQAYRLLRAQCIFCNRLRLPRHQVNAICCKLKLIQYGLVEAARAVDTVTLRQTLDGEAKVDDDDVDSESERADDLIKAQNKHVHDAIKKARARKVDYEFAAIASTETVVEARKAVILQFQAEIVKSRLCKSCNGISPTYRKNRYSGIFRKPLNARDRTKNAQKGITTMKNPLVQLNKIQRNEQRRKLKEEQAKKAERRRNAEEIDEGVADMDSSPDEHIHMGLDDVESEEESLGEDLEVESVVQDASDAEDDSLLQTEAMNPSYRQIKAQDEERQVYVNPNEIRASLVHLFEAEREILTLIYGSGGHPQRMKAPSADMFFVQNLLIPPNKYRKEQKTGPEEISESPDNEAYRTILAISEEIFQIRGEINGQMTPGRTRTRGYDDMQNAWIRLQEAVNTLFDKEKNSARGPALLRIPNGIKQKLEKKEGMFRMNIMGKRVNFAARSVISPDPNLETNEIGVPPVFAKKLTFPEPVTAYNIEEMKNLVMNGPEKWPGAIAIENENGQVMNLRSKTDEERQAIANLLLAPSNNSVTGVKNKKVHRHLANGDMVIMNRQPTLHKPSMMCHRARVLKGEKTIRMHYANCNTYNADFDGDEMNMHFPQNELAQTEAKEIADTDHQYLSATAGKPLRGLIQDHISMGVWLSCTDVQFNREDYQELLFSSLRPDARDAVYPRVKLVDPAILKPVSMWTGKQIISTILLNITPEGYPPLNVYSPSQVPPDRWGPNSEEGMVRVVDGDMLTGIMDKKQVGPTSGGMVHIVYEAYGHTTAGKFLSILGRMLTRLLNMRAFSCGVEDLVMTELGEATRTEKLLGAETIGLNVAAKYVSMQDVNPTAQDPELLKRLESVLRDDGKQAALDMLMNSQSATLSSEITESCLRPGLQKSFPKNQMQAMTTSGAKGSVVNANLISCNLGQQVLEGRRVPVMVSGKSLPCFKPFDSNIRAGGYIKDRFLTGVKPQEYYFHTMAGREGLIDTAVKTARSGYLQRCLIKGMEGLRAEHDSSVRDADGSLVQTLYGEDGLEITKQRNLTDFRFLAKNFHSLYRSLNAQKVFQKTQSDDAVAHNKRAVKMVEKYGRIDLEDPVVILYPPNRYAGSTSESFYKALRDYVEKNPDRMIANKDEKDDIGRRNRGSEPLSKRNFIKLAHLNYLRSVVEPGEAVGVVAGQSIGEPSTQMTLNTFHLAGHSAKNVTLGIPRLREILMTASKVIKTPVMTLYPIKEMTQAGVEKFSKALSRLSLSEIVDDVIVQERIGEGIYPDSRIYDIKLQFFPAEEYTKEYAVEIKELSRSVKHRFIDDLIKNIKKAVKKSQEDKSLSRVRDSDAHPDIGQSAGRVQEEAPRGEGQNEGGDSDDDDAGDDDATNAKKRSNLDEGVTYEDPDEEDEEVARQGERDASPEVDVGDDDEGGGETQQRENDGDDEKQKDQWTHTARMKAKEEEIDVKAKFPEVSEYFFDMVNGAYCNIQLQYDTSTPKILLLPLVVRAIKSTLIRATPNIAGCTHSVDTDPFSGSKDKVPVINTEGVNLFAMRDFLHIIDPNKIITNDIGAMLAIYGVEAARSTIIRELDGVFRGHSIDVDRRHLTLVADYMTRGGDFQPFSRIGMRDKTSPFAKMSFETTFGFLRDAVTTGEGDDLSSPSARITVGRIGRMGTGMFDVLMPVA